MQELIANLHNHTNYSDGEGSHEEIAQAAMRAGIDVVFTTDHNVLVHGPEGYYQNDNKRVLLLVGEEVHDRSQEPAHNHLLVLGANRELAQFSDNTQRLIEQAQRAGGLTFIAHPFDQALEMFHETAITWENWDLRSYTGIELWNGFSELKEVVRGWPDAIFYAFFPQFIAKGPHAATLAQWDRLLSQGRKVVAIGGSDAHAMRMSAGPLRRKVLPYDFHFQAINTHILTPEGLSGDLIADRRMVVDSLRQGHAFIGYDLPLSTRNFRFTVQGRDRNAIMGDEIPINESVTFQVRLPTAVECRLIKDGSVVKSWQDREICAYIAREPGAYRVECYIDYLGKRRGWIFSNPIYVRKRVRE